MALAALLISCFLFYASSKFFPIAYWSEFLKPYKTIANAAAAALAFLSLFLLTYPFEFPTALLVWMTALMTLLSAVILSVKINTQWLWFWGVIGLLFILIDLT